jgi:hypothetical protein
MTHKGGIFAVEQFEVVEADNLGVYKPLPLHPFPTISLPNFKGASNFPSPIPMNHHHRLSDPSRANSAMASKKVQVDRVSDERRARIFNVESKEFTPLVNAENVGSLPQIISTSINQSPTMITVTALFKGPTWAGFRQNNCRR